MNKNNILLYRIIIFFILCSCISILNSCQSADSPKHSGADSSKSFSFTGDANIVTAPPPELRLDTFYKKYLIASGIPIVGSGKVPEEAFFAVRKMVNKMVSMRSDILEKMIENKIRIGIMAKTEVTTDLPEYRDWNEVSPETDWNTRGRGFGATTDNPFSSCAEENVLCYGERNDWYSDEDIFIHEFAHGIYNLGISFI